MAGRWKWYALILLGVVAVPATVIPLLLGRSRPAFQSFDEVKPDEVIRLEVRLFNLQAIIPPSADGEKVPDMIGPFDARPEEVAGLLDLLKGARPVPEMPAGSYAAQFEVHTKTGKPQRIRVKFSAGTPGKPETYKVWYRIADGLEFEAACTAPQLVAKAIEAERKAGH